MKIVSKLWSRFIVLSTLTVAQNSNVCVKADFLHETNLGKESVTSINIHSDGRITVVEFLPNFIQTEVEEDFRYTALVVPPGSDDDGVLRRLRRRLNDADCGDGDNNFGPPTDHLSENEIAWLKWLMAKLTLFGKLEREEYCEIISNLMGRMLDIPNECQNDWILAADAALTRHWQESCMKKKPFVGEGEGQILKLEDKSLWWSQKTRLEIENAAELKKMIEQSAAYGPIKYFEYLGHGCGETMECGEGTLNIEQLLGYLKGRTKKGDCTIVLVSCSMGCDDNLEVLQKLADATGCVVRAPKGDIKGYAEGILQDWVEIKPVLGHHFFF